MPSSDGTFLYPYDRRMCYFDALIEKSHHWFGHYEMDVPCGHECCLVLEYMPGGSLAMVVGIHMLDMSLSIHLHSQLIVSAGTTFLQRAQRSSGNTTRARC